MSEIERSAPLPDPTPDPTPAPAPAPGWYPDHTGHQRWWDGRAWGVYAPQPGYAPPVGYAPHAAYAPQPGYAPQIHVVRAAKDIGVAYLFAIFLGAAGAHHFYLGNTSKAVAMLVMWILGVLTTFIFVGVLLLTTVVIWAIVDLFLLPAYVRRANGELARY